MIRATLSDGRFLLGIDAENVKRMRDGKPIIVDLTTMGGRDTVIILYGETMADIVAELEGANGGPLPVAMPYREPGGKPQ